MENLKTLNRLLALKERKKEEIELEVQNAFSVLRAEEDRLNALEHALADNTERLNQKKEQDVIDVHEFDLYYDYVNYLGLAIEQQKKVIEQKSQELDNWRQELAIAYREMKTYEILRDRVAGKIEQEREKRSQKEIDFIHLSRRVRESQED